MQSCSWSWMSHYISEIHSASFVTDSSQLIAMRCCCLTFLLLFQDAERAVAGGGAEAARGGQIQPHCQPHRERGRLTWALRRERQRGHRVRAQDHQDWSLKPGQSKGFQQFFWIREHVFLASDKLIRWARDFLVPVFLVLLGGWMYNNTVCPASD